MAASVLAHVAAALPQKENIATEALSFVLNRSEAARKAFGAEVARCTAAPFPFARVVTQRAMGEKSRPDLQMFSESGSLMGFLEAKIWAPLTAAQPVDYLQQLQKAAESTALLILAPEARLTGIRAEIVVRCRAAQLPAEAVSMWNLRSGNTSIVFISWTRLLSSLSQAVAGDGPVASDVAQLMSFCERFESEGFIPLTSDELDALDVPRRITNLADLVPDIVAEATSAGVLSMKGLNPMHFAYGSGRYAQFIQAGCWVGLSHKRWAKYGRSPLWVGFGTDEKWGRADQVWKALEPWTLLDPPCAYREDDGSVAVPLVLRTGAERDVVITDAVSQLRELAALLTQDGMPLLANAVQATSAGQ